VAAPDAPAPAEGIRRESSVAEASPQPAAPWGIALRVAFRFAFAYFLLFSLIGSQIFSELCIVPQAPIPILGTIWPMRQITFWVAAHVFGVTHPLVYMASGSGDKTFDWVTTFWLLIAALLITAGWSVLDRRRKNYAALHKWFGLFIRFALASELFVYGVSKVIPLQMPFPSLIRLMEPYGHFSPMGVLWSSVGASPAYEMFAGSAELLGGVLLLFPATVTLGALVALADMIQVFVLNMTYDVPVKLLSFHLIVMACLVLAPDWRRLWNFFFRNRSAAPSARPPLFAGARANRIAFVAQIVFGAYLIGINAYFLLPYWRAHGGMSDTPALYGIWNLEQMSMNGHVLPRTIDEAGAWRRIIVDRSFAAIERMDDSFIIYTDAIDNAKKTLTLSQRGNAKSRETFTFDRPAHDRLILDGSLYGQPVHATLRLLDLNRFPLLHRGFHWISEYPYNR
jgi:hypothetical protein